MRHLAALAIILLLVTLTGCKYFKGKKSRSKKTLETELLQARQDSIRIADSIMKVQERMKAIEDARLDSIRVAEEKRAWELKNKYNIIVGSFITPEYARSHAETYRQKGYDVKIIKMEGGRFDLVSAEAHSSFRKAVDRLQEIQITEELGAWMYVIK